MRRVLTCVALVVIAACCCLAQTESATLSGRVTDPTGAAVSNAEVVLINVATNLEQRTRTNSLGLYVLVDLRPARYRLAVGAPGFRTLIKEGLVLHVQDEIAENFALTVGSVSESMTVTADIAKLQTESAAVSTVVDSQFVENMPLNGRSFQSLIELAPGVTIDVSTSGVGQFSVNGQRTDTNYYMIDGVSANFGAVDGSISGNLPGLTVGGGTNGLVSVDAMQEFRIQTSTYAPEFGRSPGAQISIVTKGGSNQWHGTAFDYLRNDIFDARNYFDNAQPQNGNPALPKPPTRQNDFGGTFSGPVWKDHTFFFFSYEGLRLRLPVTESGDYFFTASAKAAVANSPNAGLWNAVVAATPTGTGPLLDPTCDNITNPCVGALNLAFSNPSNFDTYSLRLDHKLTSNISLFARYSHAPSNNSYSIFNSGYPATANADTATLGVTATLSPTLVNDFRGNWSRQTGSNGSTNEAIYGAVNPPLSQVVPPGITSVIYVPTYNTYAGPGWGQYSIDKRRQLNFVDTLSKTVGSHQLKFGADYRRMNPTQLSGGGLYVQASSWQSVLNGTVDYVANNTTDTVTSHMNNWSFFGQDTWKVSARLTLTYGLRWEINTPPVSDTAGKPFYPVEGVFNSETLALGAPGGTLWHTQLDAFAPRLGAAFQVTPKTVLRGGFGLFYDLGYGLGAGKIAQNFPYGRWLRLFGSYPLDFGYADPPGCTPPNCTYPYLPLPFTTTIGPEALSLQAFDPNLRLPLTYQWNAAIERELGAKQSITATYVGSAGRNLLFNPHIVVPGATQYIEAQLNDSSSKYNSLQVQFMRRMSHGLQATASYTYSRSFDTSSAENASVTSFGSIASIAPPPMTPSDYDIPHKFSAAVSYNVPRFASGGRVAEKVTKGWSVDSIYRYQCCAPVDVTIGEVDPLLGYVGVRPERVGGQPVWVSPTVWAANMSTVAGYPVSVTSAIAPAGKLLNPLAFTLSADGASDDALRNSIRSPYGISQFDLALRRRFNLTERVKLDIRVEYFNAFNHPMFGGANAPSANLGYCAQNTPASCLPANNGYVATTFGTVAYQTTLNQALASLTGGGFYQGQDPQYGVGGSRSAQFTLRLTF